MRASPWIPLLAVTLLALLAGCSAVINPDSSRLSADGGSTPFDAGPPMTCGVAGTLETVSCGNCGTMTRFCAGTGFWENGPCMGGGVCTPGTMSAVPCGNCGTQTSRCNTSCTWDGAGACSGEGECAAGTRTRSAAGCEAGANRPVLCSESCIFAPDGPCMRDDCPSPGAFEDVRCGNCGTQSRFCAATGVWEYGPCGVEGICAPGTVDEISCGICGRQDARCTVACIWDPTSMCVEGDCD